VIYKAQNQYHVVMEVAAEFRRSPEILNQIYISTGGGNVSGTQKTQPLPGIVAGKAPIAKGAAAPTGAGQTAGDAARNAANNALATIGRSTTSTGSAVSTAKETMVPLSAFTRFDRGNTPIAVFHQDLFAASTISFNLAPSASLSAAMSAIDDQMRRLGVPASIHGGFAGTAKAFQASLGNEPLLIVVALLTVYIVLGVLYESYVHPVTILSTLPSAAVGAILALIATDTEFSLMALLGLILLIGIVKKNAIMMIDFALDAERRLGLSSRDAVYLVCCLGNRVSLSGGSGERTSGGVDFAQDVFALGLPDVAPWIVVARGQEGDDRIGQFARRGKALLTDDLVERFFGDLTGFIGVSAQTFLIVSPECASGSIAIAMTRSVRVRPH
jgi:multidrug efflux pump